MRKLLFLFDMFFALFFALSGMASAAITSGWESESALVKLRDGDKWPTSGYYYGMPSTAYNLSGDGKWVLLSTTEANSKFFSYFWDAARNEWVADDSLVAGLKINGWGEYPALAYNVMGDNKWTLITHANAFYGYYWNGTQWVEDSNRINGLPTDIGYRTTHTLLENLNGDGKWTLITGATNGLFRAFYWNGTQWMEDSARASGLPSTSSYGRVTGGFNVFGDNKWNVILGDWNSIYLRAFYWNGTQWLEDATRAAGLNSTVSRLVPTLGYNLKGDGKWALISGVGVYDTFLGFFYNTADSSAMPSQTAVTAYHPLATTIRINFSYPYTWNHRVKYSTNSDMSNANWSIWFNDVSGVDIKLEWLKPNTQYYYEVHTYIPWDTSYYVKSPVNSFTTLSAQNKVVVSPGESIQDALEMLPPEGGTIELAAGIHNITGIIVINRNNIVIQGTHDSVIQVNDRSNPVFVIPHENPSPNELWSTMPRIENLTFKGFKVVSSYTGYRGAELIRAYNVRNVTVEDILDESYLGVLIGLSGNTNERSFYMPNEDIFVKNNDMFQSEVMLVLSRNVHISGNTIKRAANIAGVDINMGNEYVYITNNTIYGGANYNIRGHGGNYIYIENNTLLGGTQRNIWIDGLSYVTIKNNILTGSLWAAIHVNPQAPRKGVKILNNRIYNNQNRGIWTSEYDHGFQEKISDIEVINNVISYNGGDAIQMGTKWAQFNISNNIIVGNKGFGINYADTVEPTIIKYNDVWNNTLGNYNGTIGGVDDISVDPLFVDPANGDFHLKSKFGRYISSGYVYDSVTSPAIGAGENEVEMGAYGNTQEASLIDNRAYTGITTYFYSDGNIKYGNLIRSKMATDLRAKPVLGNASVIVNKFDTSLPKGDILVNFTADTVNGNNVNFTIGNLTYGKSYLIKRNDTSYMIVQADASGKITFDNPVW